ncbi:bifunctional 4-hydroxy-2-oxoglutarate aldolase/2-dehydro-3-deoxy-phosphogluconate aldolase [Streptomyces sedi]|uniref:Bifunctional 4-hydroxy-2-oxoglutarate aldolase/2-dehydro-3-deoxy-phosphogluconate aldolase n=1 Tax=Streptomyces sedi TaxID=555059 RepID=A0A5C4UQ61_9ACTN|nr:bifunctional 4-hydroxy-2-oxoglutarate aldolase/2-dehydro-3-deoxy-phosphogluconate aldolase [Streptomyces sedi]TNM25757.1 bifunctional 4-hydroxy-2-oxoglutarate aldolase/2-dehydro-3-deoxy-phosphogluconate aldolase [Streptomyces sedi]
MNATAPGGVVAIVRLPAAPPDALHDTLVDAGVHALEITLTTPGAEAALTRWRALDRQVPVGAGTVRTPDDVRRAVRAGAQFLVTPTTSPAVLEAAGEAEVPVLCGALTPTEIETAWRLGAAAVKVFPADTAGAHDYVRAVRAPLPDIPLLPTGGVDAPAARGYAALGCHGVGVGSSLVRDAPTTPAALASLGARAAALTAAWREGAREGA